MPTRPAYRALLALLLAALAAAGGCSPAAPSANAAADAAPGIADDGMTATAPAAALAPDPVAAAGVRPAGSLRVATYNASLYATEPGGVAARLAAGDPAARQVAAVIQRVRPDILLLNEVDTDPSAHALFLRDYLGVAQDGGGAPIAYPHAWWGPVNTGEPSGLDLDGDGVVGGPGDAWGFGMHPGQYGMLVLSMHPIDAAAVRTFRLLKWSRLPGARVPQAPDAAVPHWDAATWAQLRLSSKTHADLPIDTPLGRVHLLASHPTPPVFDGPEDRNGLRNRDEIRFWSFYLDDAAPADGEAPWLVDDAGRAGGLPADARFVLAGDLNADPDDGDAWRDAINALLVHPRMRPDAPPRAPGGALAAAGYGLPRIGDTTTHTGDFGPRAGTLRLDYVLPSRGFGLAGSGVFWPAPEAPAAAIAGGSDHHLAWVDLVAPGPTD
jgi:endonuclease/exonuclease/phosphatase family metal-dependent hydrolase